MKRRGLSSVIGTVFFIIVFAAAASYITYSMNQLDTFSLSVISKTQLDTSRQQEKFMINQATEPGNKLNVTFTNTGQIPINVTRMWVQNRTDPSFTPRVYTINQLLSPGQTVSQIGQNIPLFVNSKSGYDVSLITTRGNIQDVLVNSASSKPIYLQLIALPSTPASGFNTTLMLQVTNNMTNGGVMANFKPQLNLLGTSSTYATCPSYSKPISASYLPPGGTTFFAWDCIITGNPGQLVNFSANIINGYGLPSGATQSASDNVTIASGIKTGQNIGRGGSGVYASMTSSVMKFKNITSTSKILSISNNATDVNLSMTATHFLRGQWDTEVTKNSIGTSFVDVYTAPNSNGHAISIDTNGFTQYRYQIIWTYSGTGTQTCQLVDITNGANVLTTTASLASGMNTGADTAIPAGLLNTIKDYKWQCKSTVSTDSPTFLAGRIFLKP